MEKSVSTNEMRGTEIGNLPDSMLLHILSFLPAKDAVATSLLSKRWKPLWLSLPTLCLNCHDFKSKEFVDKLLKKVDLKSVKKFVLHCGNFRPGRISKWINAVMISNKVEYLEIQVFGWDEYWLPSRVFNGNNIKVLKLGGRLRVVAFSYANLPLLEVLHLEYVEFLDLKYLEKLLSTCPPLKDLVLNLSVAGFYSPIDIGGLNHLVTAVAPQSLFPWNVFSNVTRLRLYRPDECFEMQYMLPCSEDVSMFYNLTHLECIAHEWTKMVNCLQNFPKLENLVISELDSPSSSPPEPILDVPPCVSLHLKEFSLHGFRGSESELEMVKFMKKNARVLRAMYISHGNFNFKHPMFREFEACLRSDSESCSGKHEQEQPLVFMILDYDHYYEPSLLPINSLTLLLGESVIKSIHYMMEQKEGRCERTYTLLVVLRLIQM